ncbi:histidine phosphatase family protein [Rhodobacterales bacterium HKCCE2091]|nr:histidine phosphatase family protein [Rhodobacterales bacterium HKCCE2091]
MVFLTHADVVIDPAVPVPDWPLSDRGRSRHARFGSDPVLAGVGAVYSSAERKARDGAGIHAAAFGIPHRVVTALHENDRSATGYLPSDAFDRMADAFFARPDDSIDGWEPARHAQVRILAAVRTIAELHEDGDILVVSHGGVGALLRAALAGRPISGAEDQPATGGGNFIEIALPDWRPSPGWRTI